MSCSTAHVTRRHMAHHAAGMAWHGMAPQNKGTAEAGSHVMAARDASLLMADRSTSWAAQPTAKQRTNRVQHDTSSTYTACHMACRTLGGDQRHSSDIISLLVHMSDFTYMVRVYRTSTCSSWYMTERNKAVLAAVSCKLAALPRPLQVHALQGYAPGYKATRLWPASQVGA